MLYRRTVALLDMLGQTEVWPLAYLRWELSLLEDMGFGLDLTRCTVTGSVRDLVYVSPKTGRAVSKDGAGEWAHKLLPLPQSLLGQGPVDPAGIREGLITTGFFLTKSLAPQLGDKPLPHSRQRLIDALARQG